MQETNYKHKGHFVGRHGDSLDDIHSYINTTAKYIIDHNPQVKTVLDVGASDGYMGDVLKKLNPSIEYVGIDLEPDAPFIRRGDINTVVDKYDLIIYNHVLEHIPNPDAQVGYALTNLNPGGTLFVAVPHGEYPWSYEYEGHVNVFYPVTIIRLFQRAGLQNIIQTGRNFRRDNFEIWTTGVKP